MTKRRITSLNVHLHQQLTFRMKIALNLIPEAHQQTNLQQIKINLLIFYIDKNCSMLIFLISMISHASGQTNTSLGTNLYPVADSEFVLPLSNYFLGDALTYTVEPSDLFTIYQSTQYIDINLADWLPFACASYNYLNNTNLQSGYYAVLFDNGRMLALLSPQELGGFSLTQEWTIPACTLQNIFLAYGCSYVQFLDQNIIAACSQGNDGQASMVFIIFDTLVTNSVPIVVTTQVPFTYYKSFQVLNNQSISANLVVSYPNGAGITVSTFSLEGPGNTFTATLLTTTQFRNVIQVIFNEDESYFTLTQITLTLYISGSAISDYTITQDYTYYLSFAIYAIPLYNQLTDYIIALQTNSHLQNMYYDSITKTIIQGSIIVYPPELIQVTFYSMMVSSNYAIINAVGKIIVCPSYLNPYPYVITAIQIEDYRLIAFDYRSDVIIQFANNGIAQFQIARAYLGLVPNTTNLQTGSGVITITANNGDSLTCSITFTYNFVALDDIYNVVQSLPNISILYPQPQTQVISLFFYGNNLSYSSASNQLTQQSSIQQIKLEFIKSYSYFYPFWKVMQNPYDNTSYLQVISTSQKLIITLGGAEFDEFEVYHENFLYNVLDISAASVGTSPDGLIVLAIVSQNQVQIYTFPQNCIFSQFNSSYIIVANPYPKIILDCQCQAGLLYVLMTAPQSLYVYQISTGNYLYNFEYSGAFTPNAIYINDWSYGGYLFIDNQYELIITQCYITQCITSQQITYQSQDTQQSIGIGLLKDGIYIAVTNSITQSLVFYAREVIHSLYLAQPIPQIAVFPATIQFQYPIIASYTNNKFYLGLLNNNNLELAVFQPAYSIANILYSSIYIENYSSFSSISSASVCTANTYDIVGVIVQDMILIQYKVWLQANVQLTINQMNNMTENYAITYYAQTPQNAKASIYQYISAVDHLYYIESFEPVQGYPNQILQDYSIIALQPEIYFNGSIETYNCFIYNATTPNYQAMNIIGPITQSNTLTQSELISASTGYIYNSSFEQAFFINSRYLFGYNPESNQVNYTNIAPLPQQDCPILFNTYYYLVTICLNGTGNASIFLYNPTKKQFEQVTITENPSGIAQSQDVQYVNATSASDKQSNSAIPILAFWTADEVLLYQVGSTLHGVTFALIGGSYTYGDSDCTLSSILTKNTQKTLYGSLINCGNQIQLFYYYGYFNGFQQLRFVFMRFRGIDVDQYLKSRQYLTNDSESVTLVVQGRYQCGIFTFSLDTLELPYRTIQTQQNYTLQRIENYISVGLFVEGSLIVTQFEFTNATYNSTIIALYQDPQFSKQTDQLTFKALYYFDSILYNTTLTSNGTLIYNTQGFVQQLYLTSQLFVEFDLTSPLVQVIQNGSYNNLSAPIVVVAQNSKYNATQQVNINAYTVNGGVQKQQTAWYLIGFGLVFAVIIFSVLGTLCYKSRQQYQDYLN